MAGVGEEPGIVVNGEVVTVAQVMAGAKFSGRLAFIHQARDAALIRQEAEARGLEVSGEEIQEAANAFRAERGLQGSRETLAWLSDRSLSLEEWEGGLEQELLARRVRDAVVGGRIQEHFAQHLLSHGGAEISQLLVKDEGLASELALQVTEEGADFHALARRYSVDGATRPAGGYRGMVRRGELGPAAQAAVFGGREGQVVGPFRAREGWWLLKVEKLHPPILDDTLRERLAAELFEEWLSVRREQAAIRIPLLELQPLFGEDES